MQLTTKSLGGVPLLEVCEDIDHHTAEDFHDAVREAMGDHGRVLLDLTACRYVDSGGLAVMLAVTKDLDSGGWLGVVGGNKNICRLFHLVGLDTEPGFRQFSDLSAAKRGVVGQAQ